MIDTRSDTIVATVWAKAKPSDLLGASPNAIVFAGSGKRFFTANGSQNAIAVFDFDPHEPAESKLRGLIPVGWYPGAIAIDAGGMTIFAANIKGLPKVQEKVESLLSDSGIASPPASVAGGGGGFGRGGGRGGGFFNPRPAEK